MDVDIPEVVVQLPSEAELGFDASENVAADVKLALERMKGRFASLAKWLAKRLRPTKTGVRFDTKHSAATERLRKTGVMDVREPPLDKTLKKHLDRAEKLK